MRKITFFPFLLLAGCGFNLYEPFVTDESETATMVQAQIHLDKREYAKAASALADVERDTNTKRILLVSANMGEAGLDVWSIVKDILSDSTASAGVDSVFDTIGNKILGEDATTRTARISTLESNIDLLKNAPDQLDSTVQNISCFLAGILALPTVTDSTTALTAAQTTLTSIASSTTGTGSSAAECPNIAELNTSLAELKRIKEAFSSIIETAKQCNILDIGGATDGLNAVESQLNKLTSNADKGCAATPTCTGGTYCDALSLGCVQTALAGDETATAEDGIIATCELVQNCINPTSCFL